MTDFVLVAWTVSWSLVLWLSRRYRGFGVRVDGLVEFVALVILLLLFRRPRARSCLDCLAQFVLWLPRWRRGVCVLVASTVVAEVDLWLPGRYRGGCCSGCLDGVADFAFGLAKRCRGVCASCCQHGVVDLALVVQTASSVLESLAKFMFWLPRCRGLCALAA